MYEDSKQEVNNTHTETNPQSYGSKSSRAQPKPYVKAIEEYRKLCLKTYSTPNQGFASILKTEQLNLFLDTYSLPEILVMNKLIGKYFYFKHIQLAPYDPQKGNPNEKKKKGFNPASGTKKVSSNPLLGDTILYVFSHFVLLLSPFFAESTEKSGKTAGVC